MKAHKAQDMGSKRGKLSVEDFLYLVRKVTLVIFWCSLSCYSATLNFIVFFFCFFYMIYIFINCSNIWDYSLEYVLALERRGTILDWFCFNSIVVLWRGTLIIIIMPLILQDFPKLNRCTELLSMQEELKQARKAFEVDEEKLATLE